MTRTPEESSAMVQPDRQDHQVAAQRETAPVRPLRDRVVAAARGRYEGSLAQGLAAQLKAIDFSDQVILFGAGMLVSLLSFLILLSAFASNRVDDDIALRLGLDRRASGIVTHLFRSSPASLNVATATSLVFVTAGTIAVAGSLQQIYEKVFHQEHRGLKGLYRLLIWVAALCLAVVVESVAGRPVRNAFGGSGLVDVLTFMVMTPFFWWSMHFLLAGRVPWPRLLPSAIATGLFFTGLGVFSKFYFSSTIISDSRTYGTIGAVFGIMTWFVAIGAVIILGAVVGVVWEDRRGLADMAAASAGPTTLAVASVDRTRSWARWRAGCSG
jgi:membrane protein